MRILTGTLFALAVALPANAHFYDGNKMHESCKKAQFFVMGYVSGAYDALEGILDFPYPFSIFNSAQATNCPPIKHIRNKHSGDRCS